MSEGWGELAKDWDNADTQLYADRAFDSWSCRIAPLTFNMSDSRVLDFGCGTGLLTEKLAPFCDHIVAVDTSERMIEVLETKVADRHIGNVTSLVMAVESCAVRNYPELSEKFDFIVASSVCSFLPDYESTLQVLSFLLRPGGIFAQWDWLSEMPIERIRAAFEASQLTSVSIEEVFEMTMKEESMPVVLGIACRP